MFTDVATGQKAYFTRNIDSPTTATASLNQRAGGLGQWTPHGAANMSYSYKLLVCDKAFYNGFHVSGYTSNCYRTYTYWCGDFVLSYFRTSAHNLPGVAFNINGHESRSTRLVSVGLR